MFCPQCESLLVIRRPISGVFNHSSQRAASYAFQCRSCNHRFRAMRARGQGQPMPHIERRKSARIPVRIPVHVESGEGPDEGTITVISETGCSLDSKQRLKPGLLLCLYLPVGTEGRRDIAAQRVALVRTIDGNRAGLKFLTLTPQEQLELEHTVMSAIRQFGQR